MEIELHLPQKLAVPQVTTGPCSEGCFYVAEGLSAVLPVVGSLRIVLSLSIVNKRHEKKSL